MTSTPMFAFAIVQNIVDMGEVGINHICLFKDNDAPIFRNTKPFYNR